MKLGHLSSGLRRQWISKYQLQINCYLEKVFQLFIILNFSKKKPNESRKPVRWDEHARMFDKLEEIEKKLAAKRDKDGARRAAKKLEEEKKVEAKK